jgi:hypothetical protein
MWCNKSTQHFYWSSGFLWLEPAYPLCVVCCYYWENQSSYLAHPFARSFPFCAVKQCCCYMHVFSRSCFVVHTNPRCRKWDEMPDGEREGMDGTCGEGDTHACTRHELGGEVCLKFQLDSTVERSPHSERMASYVSGCAANGFGHGRMQRPNYGLVLLSTRLGRSRWLYERGLPAAMVGRERERIGLVHGTRRWEGKVCVCVCRRWERPANQIEFKNSRWLSKKKKKYFTH